MNEIVKSVLNRGVPIDTPIVIDMNDFFAAFDNKKLYEEYREAIKTIVGSISNILKFHAGDTFLPVFATLTMSEDNTKELRFSGENLFIGIREIFYPMNLKDTLEICENVSKFEDFRKSIMSIQTPDELKGKFPRLYELYINQVETNKGLNTLTEVLNDPDSSLERKMKYLTVSTDFLKEFYPEVNISREQEFAQNFSLHNFLTRMMDVVLT
ncbi:MAG: hypothetical protein K2L98_02915, partial [Bacilli bacterium]|nr:hypothetical protein [Bacilli bacterium]